MWPEPGRRRRFGGGQKSRRSKPTTMANTSMREDGQRAIIGNELSPSIASRQNSWGLYNVHGNVWEWAEDCWNASHRGGPGDGSARTGGDCGFRVVRGGSWLIAPKGVRAANRGWFRPTYRYYRNGFRVARNLD